jgi:hypothetical protein
MVQLGYVSVPSYPDDKLILGCYSCYLGPALQQRLDQHDNENLETEWSSSIQINSETLKDFALC